MVLAEDLRQAVLQTAIQGKLVKQLGTDRSVDDYLTQISDRKAILIKNKEIKKEPVLSDYANDEIQFEIPNNWRWVKLGNLCSKIGAGSTPKGGAINYVIEGVPFIREQNVYSSGLLYSGMVYITEELNELKAGSMVKPNDLLLNITGGSIGRCAITPNDFVTGNVNQHVLIIRLVDVAIIKYIHAVINSPYFQRQIREKAKGDKKGLSATSTKNFLVPFPPIEEQQRIVEKINEIMPKIDEYEKIEKELETLKKKFPNNMKDALLQAAMQGKLTEQFESDSGVISIIEQCEKDKEKAIKEGKYKKEKFRGALSEEEYPFDIPDNWEWLHISDMSLFQEGPGILAVDFRTQGVPLIRITGMQEDVVKLDGCNYLDSQMVEDKWKHFKLDLGDIVISTSASMDKIAEVTEETVGAIPYTGLIRFKMFGNINKEYFKYFIKSSFYATQINEQKSGGTIKHYGPTHLKKMIIPIPPIEEQQRIVERLDALLPLCEDLREV